MERDRQARWDADHMHTVSTKLREREYGEFLAVCAAENVTPYALVKGMLREWVRLHL